MGRVGLWPGSALEKQIALPSASASASVSVSVSVVVFSLSTCGGGLLRAALAPFCLWAWSSSVLGSWKFPALSGVNDYALFTSHTALVAKAETGSSTTNSFSN